MNKPDFKIVTNGLKNYIVNLKYFFTPLGTLFLGLVVGLSILIPGVQKILNEVVLSVNDISAAVNLSFSELWSELMTEFGKLPIYNPFELIKMLFGTDWLFTTVDNVLQRLVTDYSAVSGQINETLAYAMNNFKALYFIFILFGFLGLLGGYFLTKSLVRRTIAKRAWWKFILVSLIESTLAATLIAICAYLVSLWHLNILFSAPLAFLLFGFISLFEACAVHCKKRVNVREIITLGNILMLLLCNIIILLIAGGLSVAVAAITNGIIGICVALPLVEIALLVISMNAESYVKKICEKKAVTEELSEEEQSEAEPAV